MLTKQKSEGAVNQQVTATDLAWLAGIVDGEGSIGIYQSNHRRRPGLSYGPRVTISNTSLVMFKKIQQMVLLFMQI